MHVSVTVNGEVYDRDTLEYRTLLEFLRVDLGLTGLVHLADHFIGGRVAVVEGLGGGDKFAVDEVQKLFHGA